MKINEKYLVAIKTLDDYITVSEWAIEVGESYPELLEKANKEAKNHKRSTTGIREIAARISSCISTGDFDKFLDIDNTERPRRVKYISKQEFEENKDAITISDLEPLTRREKEYRAEDGMLINELYRLDEFRNIQKSFKLFFSLDFEIDHAQALLNKEEPGIHHPNNLQFLLKYHNGKKNNKNWKRFDIEEQILYIKKAIELQVLIADKINIKIDELILNSLFERLKLIY